MNKKSEYYWEECNKNVIEITPNGKVYRNHKCYGRWKPGYYLNNAQTWRDFEHVQKITYRQAILWLTLDYESPLHVTT